MAIDLPTLSTEVKLAKYAGMDQTAIAKLVNARNVAAKVDVPVKDIRTIVIPTGEWAKIKATAADATKAATVRGAAITFIDTCTLTDAVPASKPKVAAAVTAMLAALVADGALSAETRDELVKLMDGNISRAEQLFGVGVEVTPEQVEQARRL